MSARSGLLRTGVVTFAGIAVGAAANLLLAQQVARGAGAAGTGLFFQAVALFAILSNALQLGADTALVRALSRRVALGDPGGLAAIVRGAVLPVAVIAGVLTVLVELAAAPLGALITPSDPAYATHLIRILAPFLGAGALLPVVLGGTRGLGRTLPYTGLQNLALPLLRLVAVTSAIAAGLSIQWIAAAWAAALLPVAIAAGLVLRRQLRALPSASSSVLAPEAFWRFALPRGASTVIERALDWAGVLVVLAVAGPVAGGVYAVVNRCVGAGAMIDQAARVVVGPRISRALALDDRAAASALFTDVTRALVAVGWPFYLLLAVFAPAVLGLFGPAFVAGAPAMRLVALAMMLATSAGMVQSVLLMGGRSRWQLRNRAIQLAVLLTATIVLVPRLGLLGAAIAWVAAIAVDTALAATQVALRMGIHGSLRAIAAPALLALAVVGGGAALAAQLLGQSPAVLLLAAAVLLPLHGGLLLVLRRPLGVTALVSPPPSPECSAPRGALVSESRTR